MQDKDLTGKIIGCAMDVHSALGPGYLESVYERALAHALRKNGLTVECQRPLRVYYDGVLVGDHVADMVVQERIIVEIKAVQKLSAAHKAQLVSYLTATGSEIGLLINFGASRREFRRKYRTYRPKEMPTSEVHAD